MKLKTRLIISFCIIIFVPSFLSVITLTGFQKYQNSLIENTYGIAVTDDTQMVNTVQLLNLYTKSTFSKIQSAAVHDPDKFEDESFLEEINSELSNKYSYLIVRKNGLITYTGTDDSAIDPAVLPEYSEDDINDESGTYVDGNEQILIKQSSFHFSDGSEGSAFIVTAYTGEILPEIRTILIDGFFSVIIILFLTAGLLIIWIYRGIIYPLKKLEIATNYIREGNLDFHIPSEGTDEISQLCASFEAMRQRLKESAEQQLTSEKESRELISNIAHDLKTPITTLKGYSEGLLDGVADTPEKQNKYLQIINNKANEMDSLLNELTLYSKIDTNRIPYNFKRINVLDYFNDCIEEIGMDLETKNIRLNYFNYVSNSVQIIADPEQIRRVIHNIVGNSVKYLNTETGIINVRVKDVGDFIQVEIEDNGKGIAVKDIPFIFERFYRADSSRNSATGGSGIGLSIVKKILEDHGGKIWATSKESVGTVMYFVIRKYQEVSNE